jgi:hypothetical protein
MRREGGGLVVLWRDGEDEGSTFAEDVHVFFADLAVREEKPGAVLGRRRCGGPEVGEESVRSGSR